MKRNLHGLLLLATFCLFINAASAQKTTTVTYSGSGLNATICNVFNTSTLQVVNGLTHYPLAGGAMFVDGNAIDLQCQNGTTTATALGTGYAIKYPFKKGYIYTISITASKTSTDTMARAYLYLSLFAAADFPSASTTNAGACGPVPNNNWIPAQNPYTKECDGYVQKPPVTLTGSTFTAPSDFDFLSIVASQGSASVISHVKVTSVVIKEVLDISISPNLVNFDCGTALTQTFTANNTNNVAGINTYTWSIGGSGWQYNGSAAPATLTTTTNSITLTKSSCTMGTPGAVSVKADVTGYSSAAVTANVVLPHYTITGTYLLCTSNTYSVTGIPCPSSSITWSATPAGAVSLSPSGSSVTATAIGGGYVTLIANINTPCGPTSAVTTIAVGPPQIGSGYFADKTGQQTLAQNGTNFVCNNAITVYIPVYYANTAVWTTRSGFPSGVSWADGGNGTLSINFNGNTSPCPLQFTATTSCGTLIKLFNLQHVPCGSAMAAPVSSYMISPNPANNTVSVTSIADQPSAIPTSKTVNSANNVGPSGIERIRLFDISGKLKKKFHYSTKMSRADIDVKDLTPGVYVIEISSGKDVIHEKILVQR